jgi:hypothetical protein
MVICLWTWGEAENHDGELVEELSCSSQDGWEVKRSRGNGQGQNI